MLVRMWGKLNPHLLCQGLQTDMVLREIRAFFKTKSRSVIWPSDTLYWQMKKGLPSTPQILAQLSILAALFMLARKMK